MSLIKMRELNRRLNKLENLVDEQKIETLITSNLEAINEIGKSLKKSIKDLNDTSEALTRRIRKIEKTISKLEKWNERIDARIKKGKQ